MHIIYRAIFLAVIFLLVAADQIGFALLISFLLLVEFFLFTSVKIGGTLKKGGSSFKKGLEAEYKELESTKTNNPSTVLKEQFNFFAKRTGEEIMDKNPKDPDVIEGIAKGAQNLINTSKKVFKK